MTPDLSIVNLGSHASTTLALLGHPGTVTIQGASGVGKSLLIDALAFVLTGTNRDGKPFDPRAIRNGADKAEVKAEIGGHRVKASVTRAGSWTRAVDGIAMKSAAEHLDALGLAGRADVVRFVLAPMHLERLAAKELGRPLRDLLLSVLPAIDSRGVIAAMLTERGMTLEAGDAVDEDGAARALTTANRAADEATGALRRSQGAVVSLTEPAPAPSAAEVEAAEAILKAAAIWREHVAACARVDAENGRHAAIEERRRALTEIAGQVLPEIVDAAGAQMVIRIADAWTRHRQAVAEHRAAVGAKEIAELEQSRRVKARAELGECPAFIAVDVEPIEAEIRRVEGGLTNLRSKSVPCGECGQPKHADPERVKKGEALLLELRGKLADARAANVRGDEARTSWERTHRAIGPDVAIPVVGPAPVAPDAPCPSPADVVEAERQVSASTLSALARGAASEAVAKAKRDLAALPDAQTTGKPAEPSVARPSDDEVQAAASILRRAEVASAVALEALKARASAEAALKADEAARDAATTEARRRAVVLECVRKAPSIIADRRRALFGELGPVQLRFPPDEGRTAAIEILVVTESDGHEEIVPWDAASDGWKILADLHLRAAVRRLAGLDWLPLFVDKASLWSGAYPAIPRVVYLWTTEAGDSLTVNLENQ